MPAANDIAARANELRDLVGDNQIDDARKRLMDFVRDFSRDSETRNEAILLSRSLKSLAEDFRRDLISRTEYDAAVTKPLWKMLELIDVTALDKAA